MDNITPIFKECKSCNESKKLSSENYYERYSTKDGYNNVCINCAIIISRGRQYAKRKGVYFSESNVELSKSLVQKYLDEKKSKKRKKNLKERKVL